MSYSEEKSAPICVAKKKAYAAGGISQCCKPARYLVNGRALCGTHTPLPKRTAAFEIAKVAP